MNIAIVIPTFNRFSVTKKCIATLRENKSRNDLIIVCDSSSADETTSLQDIFGNLLLVDVGSSAWWSAAVNVGIREAIKLGYEYILVLNDDLNFNPDLVEKLLVAAKCHQNAIVSASQVANSKCFVGTIYTGLFKKTKHIYKRPKLIGQESLAVTTTNGSCLLIPADVFRKIGYFDEVRCPHLYGDTQFQLRASTAGIKTICDFSVEVIQQPNTDYIKKLSLSTMFFAKGSPLNISAYWAFCNALFGSGVKALFLGGWHHYYFIKQTLKVAVLKSSAYLKLSRFIGNKHAN